ncbi:MAG: IclR family transcriptional regulator [Rhodobacteraceae bacterium]|nr:IclR family transcriptional regulator [Paracoccaceae bacterium]
MSTVEKALGILDLFHTARPSVGLSEAARLLKRDKATVQRYLSALEAQGFLEQDPLSKAYHLGPAVTRLAAVRNLTYPIEIAAKNVLSDLVAKTGETAHLSHHQKNGLSEIAIVETSIRATRVYIDPAEILPFHATASGIAYLSCLDAPERDEILARALERITNKTPLERESVLALVEQAQAAGHSVMFGTFEADVVGMAAPVFDHTDRVCGSVAVATPMSRFDDRVRDCIALGLNEAAQAISRLYGARRQPVPDAAE